VGVHFDVGRRSRGSAQLAATADLAPLADAAHHGERRRGAKSRPLQAWDVSSPVSALRGQRLIRFRNC
jgi:hypothetical protein